MRLKQPSYSIAPLSIFTSSPLGSPSRLYEFARSIATQLPPVFSGQFKFNYLLFKSQTKKICW